ncbi:hypothetical protein L1887_61885 [Cichorium endivia]|nr:hypothetical protein L1887_61885 [Cichorium endivia]
MVGEAARKESVGCACGEGAGTTIRTAAWNRSEASDLTKSISHAPAFLLAGAAAAAATARVPPCSPAESEFNREFQSAPARPPTWPTPTPPAAIPSCISITADVEASQRSHAPALAFLARPVAADPTMISDLPTRQPTARPTAQSWFSLPITPTPDLVAKGNNGLQTRAKSRIDKVD